MIIQNDYLLVEISASGAELMRIYDKANGRELLWNGDPAYWKRRSPILFPNVGKTYGNVMRVSGASYPTSQHGFARDRDFIPEEANDTSAFFVLQEDEESLARYPFAFELRIGYKLEGKKLRVIWQVKNNSSAEMPFTIGGHPAFCFDAGTGKEDYLLRFPGKNRLEHMLLDPASGTAVAEEKYALGLEDGCLALNEAMFAHDAMIFDGGQIEEVWLCGRDGGARIGMRCQGFPNYGIWSVPGAGFVCLEPWMGRCDDRGYAGEFADKANINRLAPGGEFNAEYAILLP